MPKSKAKEERITSTLVEDAIVEIPVKEQPRDNTTLELSVVEVREQINTVQLLLRDVMIEGQHYGVIPGCGKKPSLLKAGAEKLTFIFKLASSFNVEEKDMGNFHKEYRVTCTLTHIETGKLIGQGVGSCSTMERKYRYRKDYASGKQVENVDIADQYNTVLKMAKKRAFVDATITATAASDIFTQDIEDMEFNKTEIINNPPQTVRPSANSSMPPEEVTAIFKTIKAMIKEGQTTLEDVTKAITQVNGVSVAFLTLSVEKANEVFNKIEGV